jgi:hypothetical protein
MPKYRCYIFDESNERQRAIDFEAASDDDACAEADRLHATWGYGVFELWSGKTMIHSSDDA